MKICKLKNCDTKIHAKNMCEKHYRRILINGTLETKRNPIIGTLEEKKELFLKKVEVKSKNDCWLWNKYKDLDGYGSVQMNGKPYKAHRASYELFTGIIPEGLLINHKCHNPSCVNPDHLYAGTAKENSRDMVMAGRSYKGSGEKHNQSILKEKQVIFIKQKLNEGIKGVFLAKKFGVGEGNISAIKLGKTW